ncbi:hypothetical protein ACFJIX_17470 [Roseateles sp. UC29_93]|uniref:hypothetical protein n=1 Tax=Roseateles sp. UC29_93 TaxID=3350177 RepID=UPI003672C8EE
MAGSTSNAGAVGGVSGIGAVGRLQASLRDVGGLTPGAVLRLSGGGDRNGGGSGWRLESLDSGEIMTLIEPPLDDLLPGDQVLLRVRAVVPRMELEVIERRRDPANVGAGPPTPGLPGCVAMVQSPAPGGSCPPCGWTWRNGGGSS